MLKKFQKRLRRHKKIRAKIFGTADRPRLCVYRSLKHIYAQIINDESGKTLVAASDLEIKKSNKESKKSEKEGRKNKTTMAYEVGKLIAQKAREKKIKKVIFDRGGFSYHGRIKALAEGARESGLIF